MAVRRLVNNVKNHSNWFKYYFYKFFTARQAPFTFHCRRSGMKITVPARMMQTYKEIFFDETYLKGFPAGIISSKNTLTVVDVGANVGYFSLFMLSNNQRTKIFAFEPMPMNYTLLEKYCNENSSYDFTPVNKAVSQQNGTIVLSYDATDSYTTSAGVFNGDRESDRLEVATTTLTSIMGNYKLDKIDFLKLDCEGSEYPIIYNAPSAVLEKISALAIETHPGKSERENKNSLVSHLRQHGFKIQTKRDIVWGWR